MSNAFSNDSDLKSPNFSAYISDLTHVLSEVQATAFGGKVIFLDDAVNRGIEQICRVGQAQKKIMLIGNGGSSAIVSHMQNDLMKCLGIRSMVFYDTPLVTAISNDDGYENIFEKPISLWADADDILIAVSSSGQSENILRAVRTAKEKGCNIITLSGFKPDNPLRSSGEINFYVSSNIYGHVETVHSIITHAMTDLAINKTKERLTKSLEL